MPKLPKKPCGYPGCPNLTDGRYCKEHEKQAASSYEKYGRDPAVRRRYGRAWKRILVPVDEVHHKLPLSEGGTHERSNLIALCKSCHAKIHGERGDYHGSKKHRVYSYDK